MVRLTGHSLAPEGLSLRNLEVVTELQIIGEIEGVGDCHISKPFEKVHLLMLGAKIRVLLVGYLQPRHYQAAMLLQ